MSQFKRALVAFGIAVAVAGALYAQTIQRSAIDVPSLSLAPTGWSVVHAPVAATAASASKSAAAAGVKHVATGATVCISSVAAQADLVFNLRDGATGAGTVLWTFRLASPTVGAAQCVSSPPFNIMGSAATAMTLESAAAPAASNFATASLTGYDLQ